MTQSDLCLRKTTLAVFWKRHGTGSQSRCSRSLERPWNHPGEGWWPLAIHCWWRRWREAAMGWTWRGWREVSRMTSRFWLFNLDGFWCHSLDQVFSLRCLWDIKEAPFTMARGYKEWSSEESTRLETENRASFEICICLAISRTAFHTSAWTLSKWQKIHCPNSTH